MKKGQSWNGKRKGENNPNYGHRAWNYKGGRKINNGYVFIWKPKHLMAQKNGYITEHRLVMSNYIGRMLYNTELVHHVNGNKLDNRIKNLQLMKRGRHTQLHHIGKPKIMTTQHRESISKTLKKLYASGFRWGVQLKWHAQ